MRILFGLIFVSLLAVSTVSLSYSEYSPPDKQLKHGVLPEDVLCRDDLVLLIKHDGSPACVSEASALRLLQHGWAEKIIEKTKLPDTRDVDSRVPQDTSGSIVMRGSGGGGAYVSAPSDLGFAVGGAQDINNFRENIANNFLPLYTDITYEGLFYDYYFDTGYATECEELFCPSYSYAISRDPFSKNYEYYLSVGLNSGLDDSDFERKKLNLVIVLDISGSMGSQFDRYHYDSSGVIQRDDYDDSKTKMRLANESLVGMLNHLDVDDRLGVVLFNNDAHTSKPLELIRFTNMEQLGENILDIHANGGTNMEAGMKQGTSLFDEFLDADPTKYENRIIFLTDAIPNLGDTSSDGLFGMISENSKNGIHTTFIGIGVDLNTNLVETLTKVRGANYYSIHSASEFKTRMVDEFDFMVTPLVFDLLLSLDADGYEIKKVYGSPEADESTGQIMKVNTLFPSKTVDGQTKGGLVLLNLEKISDDSSLVLKTSYEDRSGMSGGDQTAVNILSVESDYYENTGIRKGILLSRYADLMKTWAFDEQMLQDGETVKPTAYYEYGISVPDYVQPGELDQWERQSIQLQVSAPYDSLIAEFSQYFDQEMDAIKDETLQQEADILSLLEKY